MRSSLRQSASKHIPQFAPNFTVYLLPPDVVCLYSEDRKFFLHGELYCALASAIAKAERAFAELVRELERNFPSDKIHEALQRLIDRRYVVPARARSDGVVAAYWASLGFPPEIARENLQKCRVRIQSLDVEGATELGAALNGLGVRVVKRSPDLTVVLVSDYLDATARRIEPAASVGPYAVAAGATVRHFSPGRTGVQPRQERLLDLSRRSHETQSGDQGDARPRSRPAASRFHLSLGNTFGQSGIQLAAVEIAKAIASDFRTELRDHIISLDLLGLDHREALRGGPPAMSELRPQEAAGPAPRAGADRAWRRRQTDHDERRISDRFAAGHGCAFSQAREPAHRSGLASRTDRRRFADEHQLPCDTQFFRARPRPSMSSGRG